MGCAGSLPTFATEPSRDAQLRQVLDFEVCAAFPHYRASRKDTPETQDVVIKHNKVRLEVYKCPDETP